MREYYLFFIKKEIYPIYHKKSASFYRIFSKLRSCDKNNYAYGTSIFFQLCDLVPKTRLQTYFQKKQIKDKNGIFLFEKEKAIVRIMRPCIYIKTKKNLPSLFKLFLYVHPNIFICDFENQDYFWLEQYQKFYQK